MSDVDDFTLATRAVETGLTPKGITPQQAWLSIQAGRELGLSPTQAMCLVYVVEGRITLKAQAMGGCVQRGGGSLIWHESTHEVADVEVILPALRDGMPPSRARVRWTLDDARRAKLTNRGTWQAYPLAMLANRALAQACRIAAPATFMGVYDPDEVDEIAPVVASIATAPRTVPGLAPARQIEAPPPVVLDAQPAAPTRIEVPEWAAACAGELLSPDQADEVTGLLRAHGVPMAPVTKKHGEPHTWTGATVQAIVGRAAVWLAERAQRGAAQVVARGEPAAEQGGGEE